MKTFKLKIASIDKEHFDSEAISVTLPVETGEMTVLAEHTPTIAKLKSGKIKVKSAEGQDLDFEIQNGFFEFSDNTASLLLI